MKTPPEIHHKAAADYDYSLFGDSSMYTAYPACKCGKPCVWYYEPSDSKLGAWRYQCDDCIERGCSCTRSLKPGKEYTWDKDGFPTNPDSDYEILKDEQGRELPCVEWRNILEIGRSTETETW